MRRVTSSARLVLGVAAAWAVVAGCVTAALAHENRCGTFRTTYREQVLTFVETAERAGHSPLVAPPQLARRMETR